MGGSSFTFRIGLPENLGAGRVTRRRLFPVHVQLAAFAASLLPVLAGVGAGYLVAVQGDNVKNAPAFLLAGLIAGALLARAISPAVNRWSIRRLGGLASRDDVECRLTIGDDGIHFVSQDVDCRVAWTGIDRVFLDRGTLYFVMGLGVYYVPARTFSSEAERQAALEFALSRLSPDARSRSKG